MKRFTKTLLSVAAVSAVSAAMAVSAMAMTATYDAATGKVTLSGIEDTGASQTLLILDKDATTVAEGDIVQIDQKDDGTAFAEVPVGTLTGATYYVRVSGTNGNLQKATFETSTAKTTTIIVGDSNLDGSITGTDATFVTRKVGNATKGTGKVGTKYKYASSEKIAIVGDSNLDGSITGTDATFITRKVGNATKGTGKVGEQLTVAETPIAE